MKFLQSIINFELSSNSNNNTSKTSTNNRVNYDPIINNNNFSDSEDGDDDEELLLENHPMNNMNNNLIEEDEEVIEHSNPSSFSQHQKGLSSSSLLNSKPQTTTLRLKPMNHPSTSNNYYSDLENHSCPPSFTSPSSLFQFRNSSLTSSSSSITTTEKKHRKMSIELRSAGQALDSSTSEANGMDARYSRMSHEDDLSSISHHPQVKKKGKLQTFIVGVRQCNPFAMFLALALLFILMGAIAFFALVLCILLIESPEPIVILVSIDAFRYDFVDKFPTYLPTLSSLRKQGVNVGRMQPCFPTKTFPNHYSIATGQYVENHGIVSNSFYDRNAPFANKLFKQTLTDPYWWSQGEPIWITAEKQNISTATYDYPGGNVKIQGIYPSFYEPVYVKEPGIERRVGKIEQYLKMKKDKVPGAPSLIMYYVNWVDSAAHYYGVPDTADSTTEASQIFYKALQITDSFIDAVMKKIDQLGMKSNVNFLIVSDHGMLNLSPDRTIWIRTMLEKYYNETQPANPIDFKSVVTSYTVGTLVDMNVLVNSTDETLKRDTINQLYTDLQETVKRYSLNCTIYKRDEIPAKYHYNKNSRIPDILLVSEPGYYSGLDSSAWWGEKGDHGYRNDIDEMYAFFAGIGPKLKSGGVMAYETIQNIHIHSLIAELLKIKPSSRTDGNIESIKNVLSYELKK